MINTKTELNETIITESDNMSSQYKLSRHFSDLQNVANKHKKDHDKNIWNCRSW